jgi:hypothetical protein
MSEEGDIKNENVAREQEQEQEPIELPVTMRLQNTKDCITVNLWMVTAMKFEHKKGTAGDGRISFWLEGGRDPLTLPSTYNAYEEVSKLVDTIGKVKVKRVFGI